MPACNLLYCRSYIAQAFDAQAESPPTASGGYSGLTMPGEHVAARRRRRAVEWQGRCAFGEIRGTR